MESEVRTYSIAKENNIFFVVKMFRLLVILFIIKLYSRVSIFTKLFECFHVILSQKNLKLLYHSLPKLPTL